MPKGRRIVDIRLAENPDEVAKYVTKPGAYLKFHGAGVATRKVGLSIGCGRSSPIMGLDRDEGDHEENWWDREEGEDHERRLH